MTPEFRPVLDTDYYISVEVQRKIEFQRLNCLLGLEDFQRFERCKDAPEAVDISWLVTSQGKTIASGRSQDHHGGFYSKTIARTIGDFRGRKGLVCTIKLIVEKDSPELNQASPELTVSVHPSVWEGDVIAQQLAFFVACPTGLVGAVVFSFGVVSTLRVRRSSGALRS